MDKIKMVETLPARNSYHNLLTSDKRQMYYCPGHFHDCAEQNEVKDPEIFEHLETLDIESDWCVQLPPWIKRCLRLQEIQVSGSRWTQLTLAQFPVSSTKIKIVDQTNLCDFFSFGMEHLLLLEELEVECGLFFVKGDLLCSDFLPLLGTNINVCFEKPPSLKKLVWRERSLPENFFGDHQKTGENLISGYWASEIAQDFKNFKKLLLDLPIMNKIKNDVDFVEIRKENKNDDYYEIIIVFHFL